MDNVNIENRIISICSNYFMVGFCWDTAKLYRYVHAIDIHHNLKFKVQSNLCLATEQNAFHTNNNYQFQTGKHYQINFYHKNFAPVQSGCDIIWDACTKPHLWLREVKENLRHSRLWLWFLLRWLLSYSQYMKVRCSTFGNVFECDVVDGINGNSTPILCGMSIAKIKFVCLYFTDVFHCRRQNCHLS